MTVGVRHCLLGFLLLLFHVCVAAQDAGLLLGVEVREEETEESWRPEPQVLQTYWIVGGSSGVELKAVLPGLLVPQERGFLQAAIRRNCGRDPEYDYSYCRDEYWTGAAQEQRPSAPATESFGDEGPCAYETLRIQFLSAKAVGLWHYSGNSEACEPRGYHWLEESWLQPVAGGERITISEAIGKNAAQAYAAAAHHAEVELAKDLDATCEADSSAEEQRTVRRRNGAWRPQLAQQNGLDWCYLSAEVEVDLPSSFTGPDRLAVPWQELTASIPGLTDAVSTPDGAWTIALTNSELVFVPGNLSGRRTISTVPSLRVLMAQWAVGKHVAPWNEAIARLR